MGKSSLSIRLATIFPKLAIFAIGRSAGTPGGVRADMDECFKRAQLPCIQDRVTQISEPIYGLVFGRQLVSDVEYYEAQRKLLDEVAPLIIYCRVGDLDKVKHEPEVYDTPEYVADIEASLERLRILYDATFDSTLYRNANVVRYDYTQDSEEDLLNVELFKSLRRSA